MRRELRTGFVVVIVGAAIIVSVFALQLFSRLDAGQELIDEAGPVLEEQRVEGAAAGVTIISQGVDMAEPVTLSSGGAEEEVSRLLTVLSERTGQPAEAVVAQLHAVAPKTTAFLRSLSLEDDLAELPQLTALLANSLGVQPAQLTAMLQQNFPRLAQTIGNLPKVVAVGTRSPAWKA